MKGRELALVGGVTVILLIAIAVTVPVELASRGHSRVTKLSVPSGKLLRYFVVGDYGELQKGGGATQPVQVVAAQMSNVSRLAPVDFIATTGDNVYPDGMKDLFDWRQFEFMYSVFNLPGLEGKPWYPVYGNHDCDHPEPMLQAHEVYPMWNMPSAYYNFTVSLDTNTTAVFIFLDGCSISCQSLPGISVPDYCGDYKFPANSISAQYAWLKATLQDAQGAAWIIVHTHMPPFSAGSGSGDNEALKATLYPLLNEYGVDFLITGHEHLMEYIYTPEDSVYQQLPSITYSCGPEDYYLNITNQDTVLMPKGYGLQEIVIGSSGHPLDDLCPDKTTSMGRLLFGSTTFGFVQMEVTPDAATAVYYSAQDGAQLFTVQVVR